MKIFFSIAIGGSIGAVSRYYLSKAIANLISSLFPWGTLVINLTGSLLIGFFYNVFDKTIIPVEMRSFITIGFLGAFTTFSTFALENLNLLRDGEIKFAFINIIASNFFGILFALLGFYIAEIIFLVRR
jgi:CrcB protein